MMKRWQNYGLWVAISSLFLMFLQDIGVNITPEKYHAYADLVFTILVMLGVVSNPETNNKWFGDDK